MHERVGIRMSRHDLMACIALALALAVACAVCASASWTSAADLSSGYDDYSPAAAIDKNGDAVVVWFRSEPDGYHSEIEASIRNGSGAFGAPVRIDSGDWLATDPRVAMSSSGEAVAVFTQETGQSIYNTWAAVKP